MKRISLILYLGVLLVSLALAYLTWTREPATPEKMVAILRCKGADLKGLVLETEKRTISVSSRVNRHSGEPHWWVEVSRLPFSAAPKEQEAETGEEPQTTEADREPIIEVFKGNDRLTEELEGFCPWNALRRLGTLDKAKLEELGLAGTDEYLRLELASGSRVFLLGDTTFGPRNRYVQDEKTGEVFVVSGQDIQDLVYPKSRFMDRSLHAFKAADVARIRMETDTAVKELVRRTSEGGREEEGWADAAAPGDARELYKNWIRKLFSLRPTDFVTPPPGREPGGCETSDQAVQRVHLTFYDHKQEIGFLTIREATDPEGKSTFYACTESTEIPVTVAKTQVENLLKDMEDVLSEASGSGGSA